MMITNKVYNVLRFLAQYLLPGLGTLYFALSGIWGLPYGDQVVGSIIAIDAFLGVIVSLSAIQYKNVQKMATNEPKTSATATIVKQELYDSGTMLTISSDVYDILVFITNFLIPATGTLYFALSVIWHLPYGDAVVGTLTAIDAFMGFMLGLSSNQYHLIKKVGTVIDSLRAGKKE